MQLKRGLLAVHLHSTESVTQVADAESEVVASTQEMDSDLLSCQVPPHLIEMFEKGSEGLNGVEKPCFAQLL